MARKQILFVFDENDKHHELVVPHLRRKPLIFEPADIANKKELSFINDGSKQSMLIGDHILNDVSAIWWRKMMDLSVAKLPTDAIQSAYGDPTFADYAIKAVQRHARTLGAFFHDTLWVSDPFNIQRADNKAWQLRVAYQLGMAVPKTLQTSSAQRAKEFVEHLDGECIVKSMSNRFPVTSDGQELMFWSQKVPSKGMSYKGLNLAPAIFQQAIEGFDLRVTVVGEAVFGSKIIVAPDAASVRDWRVVGQGISGSPVIEPYTMPKELAEQCKDMIKRLGLLYGALDFVVDKEDTHWFLEVNPMGAWGFIEEVTGQPIGKAMADLLMSGD